VTSGKHDPAILLCEGCGFATRLGGLKVDYVTFERERLVGCKRTPSNQVLTQSMFDTAIYFIRFESFKDLKYVFMHMPTCFF